MYVPTEILLRRLWLLLQVCCVLNYSMSGFLYLLLLLSEITNNNTSYISELWDEELKLYNYALKNGGLFQVRIASHVLYGKPNNLIVI